MKEFGSRLKRAVKVFAATMSSREYKAAEKKIAGPHCEGEEFAEGNAQLNTAGMTCVGFDWANKSATTLACDKCGRIQWYLDRPDKI